MKYIIKTTIYSFMLIVLCFLVLQDANARMTDISIDEYFREMEAKTAEKLEKSVVENTVTAEANSGANRAESGEIINGEASAKGSIKTIINGEVVEDVEISETETGSDAKIEIESSIEVNGEDEPRLNIKTRINGVEAEESFFQNEKAIEEENSQMEADTESPASVMDGQGPVLQKMPVASDEAGANTMAEEAPVENEEDTQTVNDAICSGPVEPCAQTSGEDKGRDEALFSWLDDLFKALKTKFLAIFNTFI